jgi:hypothetical protein
MSNESYDDVNVPEEDLADIDPKDYDWDELLEDIEDEDWDELDEEEDDEEGDDD